MTMFAGLQRITRRIVVRWTIWFAIAGLTSAAVAGDPIIPNSFSPGEPALAAEVNENFSSAANAITDNQSSISDLEVMLGGLMTRVQQLEDSPGLEVETHYATDLMFLLANGNLTVPFVQGNQSPVGTVGTGPGWHPIPSLTDVTFTVDEDNTIVLFQSKGRGSLPTFNGFARFEIALEVNDAIPPRGAIEELVIVTDDNISGGDAHWNLLHPVTLNAGQHTFSILIRTQFGQNQATISLDGRSVGTDEVSLEPFPGLIKATLMKIQ
ncbi:MAG: hypothetical protein AAGH65_03765 [Pseudomonadota bacterium]